MHGPKAIYLDNNATTPLDPRVLATMMPYLTEHFGNPASSQHIWGWMAQRSIETSRAQVAHLIGAKAPEITFTSGATEGNNWVLQSLFYDWNFGGRPGRFHVLTSAVEHSSVLNTLKHLKALGADVEILPVNSYGQVQVQDIEKRISSDTKLLSFIWGNNEVGSLNPVAEIGELAHAKKIYFHSDATQAVGKVKVDLKEIKVDFLTLSAHKIYGPKGSGALYVRSRDPRIEIHPLIIGGGQERGLRSGTVNVPAVVGLGTACEICEKEMTEETAKLLSLREDFLRQLRAEVPQVRLNGDPVKRIASNLSLTFCGSHLDSALPTLMRLGFSTGSACHSGSGSGSHVLRAMGLSSEDAACTLRLSMGRFTTAEDMQDALHLLKKAFSKNLN